MQRPSLLLPRRTMPRPVVLSQVGASSLPSEGLVGLGGGSRHQYGPSGDLAGFEALKHLIDLR